VKNTALKLRPLDVLYLRGNRLFGGPGDHGESLMPPWPSVFAGAVYSHAMAVENRISEASESEKGPEIIKEMYGDTLIHWIGLAKKEQVCFPLPSDLVIFQENDSVTTVTMKPEKKGLFAGCITGHPVELPEIPLIRTKEQKKPSTGYWITAEGLQKHLRGDSVSQSDLVPTSSLWLTDPRLGIALNTMTRTAEESRIYTTEAVALAEDTAFVCLFSHEKGELPNSGICRFGGDGRGTEVSEYKSPPQIGRPECGWKRFRMILSTPCPSDDGWIPPRVKREGDDYYYLKLNGLRARLMSASVNRYEVISGWDLAKKCPKDAVRVIPAGSVYWFEVEQGDTSALEEIWKTGLIKTFADRRREGFGSVWFGMA